MAVAIEVAARHAEAERDVRRGSHRASDVGVEHVGVRSRAETRLAGSVAAGAWNSWDADQEVGDRVAVEIARARDGEAEPLRRRAAEELMDRSAVLPAQHADEPGLRAALVRDVGRRDEVGDRIPVDVAEPRERATEIVVVLVADDLEERGRRGAGVDPDAAAPRLGR